MSEPRENRIVIDAKWPDQADAHGDCQVNWMYPLMYSGEGRSRLRISLFAVRAADDLIIEFDGPRNGWVIRMDRFAAEPHEFDEPVEEAAEVAFVPAWYVAPDPSTPDTP
jgi:hypothetical protein